MPGASALRTSPDAGGPIVVVVGIGADGWEGLSPAARGEVGAAEVLMGSARQLALVPEAVTGAERVAWPSPMLPAVPGLIAEHADRAVCVLASGDPMFHGLGTTLVRLVGPHRVRVLPHPSSVSLACARMGWPAEDTTVVSLVGRPVELLNRVLAPARRVLVLSADATTPALVAGLLAARGYGPSSMTVLEQLGGPAERLISGTAEHAVTGPAGLAVVGTAEHAVVGMAGLAVVGTGGHAVTGPADRPDTSARPDGEGPPGTHVTAWPELTLDALNVVAIECRAATKTPRPSWVTGLPDEAFEHDGQVTKREVRAVTLSRLAPLPGELLWDVGAGAGSIAIEWMRAHPACRAVAIESRPERAARIGRNAAVLGVPGLRVVTGSAPVALAGLEPPDAVFVGGGATTPGTIETCWDALRPGGRLVVNAVTVESEATVAAWHAELGGDLVRIAVHRAGPVGGFTAWRPLMPVTVWAAVRR